MVKKSIDSRYIVYSFPSFKKRGLNVNNYNDDLECGLLFFSKDSLERIKDRFVIVGYYIIDKIDKIQYLIDIMNDKISFFEGEFNQLQGDVKEELLGYNIVAKKPFYTEFMYRFQFKCDFNVFNMNNAIKLFAFINNNDAYLNKCIDFNLNIYFPNTFLELCEVVRNIIFIFDMDYMNMSFVPYYKYLLFSLENRLFINFTDEDIYVYFLNFCKNILHYYFEEEV